MKRLLTILGLLITASAFGSPDSTGVTVHLGDVSVIGSHTNLEFKCNVIINNQTDVTLIATNLFSMPPGLALKVVTDLDGKESKRMYAVPWEIWKWTIAPGSPQENKGLFYVAKIEQDSVISGISLPDTVKTVRLQIEGMLSGSSYGNSLTSNVVEVEVPK